LKWDSNFEREDQELGFEVEELAYILGAFKITNSNLVSNIIADFS
jgi:hypothetical protein